MSDMDEKEDQDHARTDPRVALIQSYTLKAFKVTKLATFLIRHKKYLVSFRLDKTSGQK